MLLPISANYIRSLAPWQIGGKLPLLEEQMAQQILLGELNHSPLGSGAYQGIAILKDRIACGQLVGKDRCLRAG